VDGYWERNLGPWDVAAGIVLVREAGGYVTEIEGPGRPESGASILAANDVLHRPLLRMLAGREARRPGEAAAP
jgi:myo-inositol-1(or 4)-monophosphatase